MEANSENGNSKLELRRCVDRDLNREQRALNRGLRQRARTRVDIPRKYRGKENRGISGDEDRGSRAAAEKKKKEKLNRRVRKREGGTFRSL